MKIISPYTKLPQRLPPGQKEIEELPVLDIGKSRIIKKEEFELEITDNVKAPVKINFEKLISLPYVDLYCDLHCVESWSKLGTNWRGVQTKILYDIVQPTDCKHIMAYSYDGYTTNIPLEYFLKEDSIIAYQYEGKDIPHEHGGPVRLLIPSLYFWKSAKWLCKIEFIKENKRGFWEEKGYHDRGDILLEERRRT